MQKKGLTSTPFPIYYCNISLWLRYIVHVVRVTPKSTTYPDVIFPFPSLFTLYQITLYQIITLLFL